MPLESAHLSSALCLSFQQLETQQKEKKSSKYAGLEREAQRENQEFIEEQRDQVRTSLPEFGHIPFVFFIQHCSGLTASCRAAPSSMMYPLICSIDKKRKQVQLAREDQDLVLEDMSVILKSIGVMAEEMQSEIADQGQMLAENNRKADDVNDKSQLVIARLQAMLNTNGLSAAMLVLCAPWPSMRVAIFRPCDACFSVCVLSTHVLVSHRFFACTLPVSRMRR